MNCLCLNMTNTRWRFTVFWFCFCFVICLLFLHYLFDIIKGTLQTHKVIYFFEIKRVTRIPNHNTVEIFLIYKKLWDVHVIQTEHLRYFHNDYFSWLSFYMPNNNSRLCCCVPSNDHFVGLLIMLKSDNNLL